MRTRGDAGGGRPRAGVVARPLLVASLDPDVAAARGSPVRALHRFFLVVAAVTPAAIAQRLSPRPFVALWLAALLAVLFVWAGLTLGYYTPYTVSFLISALAFAGYLGAVTFM